MMECKDAAFSLLLDSRPPLGSAMQGGMLQNAAHEIAHALTAAKPLKRDCAEYDWMREALAKRGRAKPDMRAACGRRRPDISLGAIGLYQDDGA